MPNISSYLLQRFGIAVFMYYYDSTEHHTPHIHVRYQDQWAAVGLDGALLAGTLPGKVQRRVRGWLALNEEELAERWARAVVGKPITPVD